MRYVSVAVTKVYPQVKSWIFSMRCGGLVTPGKTRDAVAVKVMPD
jgi:hypothetical protein